MQLCLFSQRWRAHRESYRPAGEPINPTPYEVAEEAVGQRWFWYRSQKPRTSNGIPRGLP